MGHFKCPSIHAQMSKIGFSKIGRQGQKAIANRLISKIPMYLAKWKRIIEVKKTYKTKSNTNQLKIDFNKSEKLVISFNKNNAVQDYTKWVVKNTKSY